MKGFTLIELLIYVSIALVVLLASGKLLKGMFDYQAGLGQRSVWLENSSRALRDMGFAARAGAGFEIQGGGVGVKILVGDDEVIYALDSGRLKKQVGVGEPYFVTGGDVVIDNLSFEDVGGVLKVGLSFDEGQYLSEGFFFPRNQ